MRGDALTGMPGIARGHLAPTASTGDGVAAATEKERAVARRGSMTRRAGREGRPRADDCPREGQRPRRRKKSERRPSCVLFL